MNKLKKIISALLTAAILLSGCGAETEDPTVSWKVAEACSRLDEAFPEAGVTPTDDGPAFGSAGEIFAYNTDGGAVYVYRYASRDDAITRAGYFSADGTSYSEPGNQVTVDYVGDVHLWQCDDCIVRFVGGGITRMKLEAIFGDQFAGGSTYSAEDAAAQAEMFAQSLEAAGVEIENTVMRPLVGDAISGMSWFWGGNTVFAYGFATKEAAAAFAEGEANSGFGSTFALYTEDGEPMERSGRICQVGPVVYLIQGDDGAVEGCLSSLGTVDEYGVETVAENPENGDEADPLPDVEDPEAKELIRLAKELGIFESYEYENPPKADFSGYEHVPEAVYSVNLTDGGCAYMMLYDSGETAEDESENYSKDGSEYNGIIIDYALPIHYLLSGRAIIQLGTWDYGAAGKFEEHYGAQFAGDVEASHGTVSADMPEEDPSETPEAPVPPDEPDEVSLEELSFETVEKSVSEDGEFPVDGLRSDAVLANSPAELESYIKSCTVGGVDISEFDESFFETRSVMACLLYEPTVSEGHEVLSARLENGTLEVDIENCATGDTAIDLKILFVKFDKKIHAGDIVINRHASGGVVCGIGRRDGFAAEYVRTDGDGYPDCEIINSRQELENYYNKIKNRVFRPEGFAEAMENYPEEWFTNNTLVIVAREFGSGSTRVTVTDIAVTDSFVDIGMAIETPETYTDDMAGWQIMVGIEQKIDANCEIRVNGRAAEKYQSGAKMY